LHALISRSLVFVILLLTALFFFENISTSAYKASFSETLEGNINDIITIAKSAEKALNGSAVIITLSSNKMVNSLIRDVRLEIHTPPHANLSWSLQKRLLLFPECALKTSNFSLSSLYIKLYALSDGSIVLEPKIHSSKHVAPLVAFRKVITFEIIIPELIIKDPIIGNAHYTFHLNCLRTIKLLRPIAYDGVAEVKINGEPVLSQLVRKGDLLVIQLTKYVLSLVKLSQFSR